MTKEDYSSAHTAVRMAYSLLKMYPYGDLLDAIGTAHAIGPMLDPTLYRDKMKPMDEDANLFRAAHAFVGTIDDLLAKGKMS